MYGGRKITYINIINIIVIILLSILILLNIGLLSGKEIPFMESAKFSVFAAVFISIIIEAMPFVLLGAVVSSIIHILVPESFIARIIPKNKVVGIVVASLLGLIFPVCECAVVPIMRRLIKKGVPLYIGVTFMLAAPIVNPVVLMSTYYAFSDTPYIVFLRGSAGLISAIFIGYLVSVFQEKNPVRRDSHELDEHHNHSTHDYKISAVHIIEHTSSELYEIGSLLIFGAFLSALMQTFVSREFILSIGRGNVSSTLVMMALAFVLSLCSEADAFIARTFMGQFTLGSILAFMVLGPMIDIKNTFILSGGFKTGFVLKLIIIIFSVCFIVSSIVNIFFF